MKAELDELETPVAEIGFGVASTYNASIKQYEQQHNSKECELL
jgi:hypothetical protein